MRQSYHPDFVEDEGQMIGFYFDNGGCAEHEWGIKKLEQMFGIDRKKFGFEGRLITRGSNEVVYFKYKSQKIERACLLYSCRMDYVDKSDKKAVRKAIENFGCFKTRTYNEGENSWISAGWSDEDFGIYVAGKEYIEHLDKIYEAFCNNDIVMFIGNAMPNNPFSRGGLTFIIGSAFSEENKQEMYDVDMEEYQLQEAARPIIEKVRKAGLKFHALSPQWCDEKKTKLRFWLNPWDQQNNYFGWVGVKDLEDWIKGKGFIPGHGFAFERSNKEEYNRLVEERRLQFFEG